jgi:uncharacterized membrane protein YkvA (DUF1232 family)
MGPPWQRVQYFTIQCRGICCIEIFSRPSSHAEPDRGWLSGTREDATLPARRSLGQTHTTSMNLDDIQAVITSAKARGPEPLERFLRECLPDSSEEEIQETADASIEIIESIPLLIAAAKQAAREQSLSVVVEPLLERAVTYFMHPVDLIPEMTQGLAGLLDDSYLVLRILSNLEKGPKPLVDWDLEYPTAFLRRLIGEKIAKQLDAMSLMAFDQAAGSVQGLWSQESHEA